MLTTLSVSYVHFLTAASIALILTIKCVKAGCPDGEAPLCCKFTQWYEGVCSGIQFPQDV